MSAAAAMQVDSAPKKPINPPIPPLFLGDWKTDPTLTAEKKSFYAKLSMVPTTATAAQRRRAFESALATGLDVKMNPTNDAKTMVNVRRLLADNWSDLLLNAADVGRTLNLPFFGLQLALYGIITAAPFTTDANAARLIECVQSIDAARNDAKTKPLSSVEDSKNRPISVSSAFTLMSELNQEMIYDQQLRPILAKLAAVTENCFVQPFATLAPSADFLSRNESRQAMQIVRELTADPLKGLYLTINKRSDPTAEVDPVFALQQLFRSGPRIRKLLPDAHALGRCMQLAWSAQPLAPALAEANSPIRKFMLLKKFDEFDITSFFDSLDYFYGFSNLLSNAAKPEAIRATVRNIVRRIELCIWPPPTKPMTADSGSAAAAAAAAVVAAAMSDEPPINPNFGAAGIAVGNNAANYESSIGSAYSAVSGRPVVPVGRMMLPPKPTVIYGPKFGGRTSLFRTVQINRFF